MSDRELSPRCRKCGSGALSTRYIEPRDRLARRCCTCEYRWEELPLDVSDQEIQKQLGSMALEQLGRERKD